MQVVCDMVFVVFGLGFLYVVGESYLLNHQKGLLGFCVTLVHVVALYLINMPCDCILARFAFCLLCCS